VTTQRRKHVRQFACMAPRVCGRPFVAATSKSSDQRNEQSTPTHDAINCDTMLSDKCEFQRTALPKATNDADWSGVAKIWCDGHKTKRNSFEGTATDKNIMRSWKKQLWSDRKRWTVGSQGKGDVHQCPVGGDTNSVTATPLNLTL